MSLWADTDPANITTRLLSPNAFVSCNFWWKSLDFLHFENIDMLCQIFFLGQGKVEEQKNKRTEEQKVETVLFTDS